MATSLLLNMSTDQSTAQESSKTNNAGSDHEPKPEPARSRGRKPSAKSQNQKTNKVPQRGMGVEQLERLRVQEIIRKQMSTETTTNVVDALVIPNSYPIGGVSVPVLHGTSSYGGPGMMGGIVGYAGPRGAGGSGQLMVDPSRVRRVNLIGSGFENSKELSSIPKFQQQCGPPPDRCDACFKKIRSAATIGSGAVVAQMSQINGYDFLGIEQARNQSFKNELISGFGLKPDTSSIYTGHNVNESVEVLAIHRKRSSQDHGGSIVMEYEFFPGIRNGRSSSSSKGLELPEEEEASVAAVTGEASHSTKTSNNNYYNNIDLSLKL